MARKGGTLPVVLALVVVGTVCGGLRYRARRDLRKGRGDTVWRLTYRIECEAEGPGANLRVAVPRDTRYSRVFRQDFRNSNLRIYPLQLSSSGTREVVAAARNQGECELTLRFDLQLSPRANWPVDEPPLPLTTEARAEYLESDREIQLDGQALRETLERLREKPADQLSLAGPLYEYCRQQISLGEDDAPGNVETALREGLASPLGRTRVMVALCRASKIPARLVAGFRIEEARQIVPHVWVEVLTSDRWVPYDPVSGYSRDLPYNFVPARRGGARIVLAGGVSEVEAEFSIVELPGRPGGTASGGRRPIEILDLTRLPLEMHEVLSLILLMPLGALVTCVFRNIIGIRTSGTFTPMLLALAFVFADWRTGLVVLAAVITLGITTRTLLERLKLLLVPRLSVILTLVICCIVFGVSLLDFFRWTPGAHAVLLPMVILTMIVERFYVTAEEDGLHVAVQRLAGTILVGSVCYLILRWETVARLLLVYPEAHLFTVAALIMTGRYTGYQLTELWRFRDVAGPQH